MHFSPSTIKFLDTPNFDEGSQWNMSCCGDDGIGETHRSGHYYFSAKRQDTELFSVCVDDCESVLDTIMRKLCSEKKDEEVGPHIELDSQFLPIKIPFSESYERNFDFLDFPYSPLSFFCFNNAPIIHFRFCRKEANRKMSQFCISHSLSNEIIDNIYPSHVKLCEPTLISSGNYQVKDHGSPVKVLTIIYCNYLRIFMNWSSYANSHKDPFSGHEYYHCSHSVTFHLHFCQLTEHTPQCHPRHLNVTFCTAIFDKIKLFVSKLYIFINITLTIKQRFILLMTVFPIKNSGFDFYSTNNFLIMEVKILEEILSNTKTLLFHRRLSLGNFGVDSKKSNLEYHISSFKNNHRLKTIDEKVMTVFQTGIFQVKPCLSRSSTKNSKNSISVGKNIHDFYHDVSSQSISSRCRPRYNFQKKTDVKMPTNILCSVLLKSPVCKLTSDSSHYLPSHKGSTKSDISFQRVRHETANQSFSKQSTISKFDLSMSRKHKKLHFFQRLLVNEQIIFEMHNMLESVVETNVICIVKEVWHLGQILAMTTNGLPLVSTKSLTEGLKFETNWQTLISNRRSKFNKNKDAVNIRSYRSSKQNLDKNLRTRSIEKIGNTSKNPCERYHSSIYDLITSQTIFGQPPKRCFKSKYVCQNKINSAHNLIWNLVKTNPKLDLGFKDSPDDTIDNHCAVPLISNKPASIFDFVKSRCFSAVLVPNSNLTNEELIKASKRPFSHTGFAKLSPDGFPKGQLIVRKSFRGNSQMAIDMFSKRSRETNKIQSIPMINRSWNFDKDSGKSSRKVLMGRNMGDPKRKSADNRCHLRELIWQNHNARKQV